MDKKHLPADEAVASYLDTVQTLRHTRTLVTVSPDIAVRLLATVDLNISRLMNGTNVHRLAVAMREGTWDQSANYADPLTFTQDGRLRNGKQRLIALILSGTTHNFSAHVHQDPEVQA